VDSLEAANVKSRRSVLEKMRRGKDRANWRTLLEPIGMTFRPGDLGIHSTPPVALQLSIIAGLFYTLIAGIQKER
jgi:hypothetical protein